MATVHIWRPQGIGWGHASVEVKDGHYISWWPANRAGPLIKGGFLHTSPAFFIYEYAGDCLSEGRSADYNITIEGLNEHAMIMWWLDFRNTQLLWEATGTNCARVAATALKVGGGDERASWWDSWAFMVWSPMDVLDFARSIAAGA